MKVKNEILLFVVVFYLVFTWLGPLESQKPFRRRRRQTEGRSSNHITVNAGLWGVLRFSVSTNQWDSIKSSCWLRRERMGGKGKTEVRQHGQTKTTHNKMRNNKQWSVKRMQYIKQRKLGTVITKTNKHINYYKHVYIKLYTITST